MDRRVTFLVLTSVCILTALSCNQVKNPGGVTPPPDTTGNGGGGNGGGSNDYGDLYFTSDSSTLWLVEGAASVNQGTLLGENELQPPGDTSGSCTLLAPIDFGNSLRFAFTWKGGVTNGASYKVFIGSSPERWQELPYHTTGADLQVAQAEFMLSAPVLIRFEFTLPPDSRVRIAELKGYGA